MAPLVRLGIRVRADEAELALARLLPVLAAGAVERTLDGAVEYATYAPAGELPALAELRALAGEALVGVVREPVEDGWARRWHTFLRPVRVGELTIRPPWVAGRPGDVVIHPGEQFGAGGHPTTRLCLRLLLGLDARGSLCDWGAGTGALAVVAARLGYAPVRAVELDAAALPVIAGNAAANGVEVLAEQGDVTAAPPWARTVTANLTRPLLLTAAERLTRPPERLLLSGVLREEADGVVAAFAARGLCETARLEEDGWAGVALAAA